MIVFRNKTQDEWFMKAVAAITAGAVVAFVFVVATSPKLQSVLGLSL